MTPPVYPASMLDVPDAWARIMGEFWREHWQQPDFLAGILRWLEAAKLQLSTDLQETEACVAQSTVPTYHREWWLPIEVGDAQTGNLLTYGGRGAYGGRSDQTSVDGQVYAYGTRASSFGSHRLFQVPDYLASAAVITDAPAAPTVVWVRGIDFDVDPVTHSILLPLDPTKDQRFLTSGTCVLWAAGCYLDYRHGYVHTGSVLGCDMPTSHAASAVMRLMWRSAMAGGATLADLYDALLAVVGSERPTAVERVELITYDGTVPVICTQTGAYRQPAGSRVVVAVGDEIGPGTQLVYEVAAVVAPRAWYPWGARAKRAPKVAGPDAYVAEMAEARIPVPRAIVVPPASIQSSDVTAVQSAADATPSARLLAATAAKTPALPAAAASYPAATGAPDQLMAASAGGYVSVHGWEKWGAPVAVFDGVVAPRAILLANHAHVGWFDRGRNAFFDIWEGQLHRSNLTEEEAQATGLVRVTAASAAQYAFPDVILANRVVAVSAPPLGAYVEVASTGADRSLVFRLRNGVSGQQYVIRNTGGMIPERIRSSSGCTLRRLNINDWLITCQDGNDSHVHIVSSTPAGVDTLDLNALEGSPAQLAITPAYQYAEAGSTSSAAAPAVVADLVLPGGAAAASSDQLALYQAQAAGLMPRPAVTLRGPPRVLLIASHPSGAVRELVRSVAAATGYAVDVVYAWELRRGIATNTLQVAGSLAPFTSFQAAVDAMRAGVVVTTFMSDGAQSTVVASLCAYALVVWDSSGGIADLPDGADELVMSGRSASAEGVLLSRVSDRYAWLVPDPAAGRYEQLLVPARAAYTAAAAAADRLTAAAVGLPASNPAVPRAISARLAAGQRKNEVERLEYAQRVDGRTWGLHDGVVDVLEAAKAEGVGILFTGGTLARDLSWLAEATRVRLLSVLGLRVDNEATAYGSASLVDGHPIPVADDAVLMAGQLPVESGVVAQDALPVATLDAGGCLASALVDGSRVAVCNFRLVDGATGQLPGVDPATRLSTVNAVTDGTRLAGISLQRGSGAVVAATASGPLSFADPVAEDDDAIAAYREKANAHRALFEHVVDGDAPEAVVVLSPAATAAAALAGYVGEQTTAAELVVTVNGLDAVAGLAAARVSWPGISVRAALSSAVPAGRSVRHEVRAFTNTYSPVPDWIGVYDGPGCCPVVLEPHSVRIDCPAEQDLAFQTARAVLRVEVRYSLVSIPRLANSVSEADSLPQVVADYAFPADEQLLGTVTLGGAALDTSSDSLGVAIEVGQWNAADVAVQNAYVPGRILVRAVPAGDVFSTAADVSFFTPTALVAASAVPSSTGGSVATVTSALVVSTGSRPVAALYRLRCSTAGTTVRKQYSVDIATHEVFELRAYPTLSRPAGIVLAPVAAIGGAWRTYYASTGVTIESGELELSESRWYVPEVDTLEATYSAAAGSRSGAVMFEARITLVTGDIVSGSGPVSSTATPEVLPPLGMRVGVADSTTTSVVQTEIAPSTVVGTVYALSTAATRLATSVEISNAPTSYPIIGRVAAGNWNITPRRWTQTFPGVPTRLEYFQINYEGSTWLDEGSYLFRITSDDAASLWLNDSLVVQDNTIHAPRTVTSSAAVVVPPGGDTYSIKLHYMQGPRYDIALVVEYSKDGAPWALLEVRSATQRTVTRALVPPAPAQQEPFKLQPGGLSILGVTATHVLCLVSPEVRGVALGYSATGIARPDGELCVGYFGGRGIVGSGGPDIHGWAAIVLQRPNVLGGESSAESYGYIDLSSLQILIAVGAGNERATGPSVLLASAATSDLAPAVAGAALPTPESGRYVLVATADLGGVVTEYALVSGATQPVRLLFRFANGQQVITLDPAGTSVAYVVQPRATRSSRNETPVTHEVSVTGVGVVAVRVFGRAGTGTDAVTVATPSSLSSAAFAGYIRGASIQVVSLEP